MSPIWRTSCTLHALAYWAFPGARPYAVACAAKLPERVSLVLLVCALGPTEVPGATRGMIAENRWMLHLVRVVPWVARILVRFGLEQMRRSPEQGVPAQILKKLPAQDLRALASPGRHQALAASFQEGLRGGVEGALWDGHLFSRAWGFPLEEVMAPVWLWHGEADIIVPPGMGRHQAAVLPNCRASFIPREGHFSLPFNYMREIIGAVVAAENSG